MPNTAHYTESNQPHHNSDHHLRASIGRERKFRTIPNAEVSSGYAVASYGFDPYTEKQAALNFSTAVNNQLPVGNIDVYATNEAPVIAQSDSTQSSTAVNNELPVGNINAYVQPPLAVAPEAPAEQTELEQLREQIQRFYADGLQ